MQLPQQSSHWYKHEDGLYKPFFEVPRKDGKGMKRPDINDAIAHRALPSVTTILKVIDKPSINNYRVYQALMASFTLPRIPGEAEDAFAQRVIDDSEQHGLKAREFGTRLHDAIAEWIKDSFKPINPGWKPIGPDLIPFIETFKQWASASISDVYGIEQIVGDTALGYAGMLDLHCGIQGSLIDWQGKRHDVKEAVIDYKSQAVKNDKPVFYLEWKTQLSAYSAALKKDVALVSVVIDSKTPRAPFVHVWPKGKDGYYLFLAAFDWWKYLNDYDPRENL